MKRRVYCFIGNLARYNFTIDAILSLLNNFVDRYEVILVACNDIKQSQIDERYKINFDQIKFLSAHQNKECFDINYKYIMSQTKTEKKDYLKKVNRFYRGKSLKDYRRFVYQMTRFQDLIIAVGLEALLGFKDANERSVVYVRLHYNKAFNPLRKRCIRPPYVINLGIDLGNHYKSIKKLVIPLLSVKKEDFSLYGNTICCIQRFEDEFHPLEILRLAKILVTKKVQFTLIIYGDGTKLADMDDYITINHLEDYVKIKRKDYDVSVMLSHVDLLVDTADNDYYRNNVIEASCHSIPTMCLKNRAKELHFIQNGDNGEVFSNLDSLANRIIELFNDKVALSKMKSKAYNYGIKMFDTKKTILAWNQLLTQIFIEEDKRKEELYYRNYES